jgi:hypothetical protein
MGSLSSALDRLAVLQILTVEPSATRSSAIVRVNSASELSRTRMTGAGLIPPALPLGRIATHVQYCDDKYNFFVDREVDRVRQAPE